jgi:hypothetical protein
MKYSRYISPAVATVLERTYCDEFAQSIARELLGKHPVTHVHAKIEGRPSLGNGEVNTLVVLGNGVFDAVCAMVT